MNSEIIECIKNTLQGLGQKAQPLSVEASRQIISSAQKSLVNGNPRVWWMSPKGKVKIYDSKKYKLKEILPSNDSSFWFIPEIEQDDLSVFDLSYSEIEAVIEECPFFEYYVLNKQSQWFVVESDHNQFHVCYFPNSKDAQ